MLTEQAVGFALHALEPDEEMEFVRHLPECSTCREAVADAHQVLNALGSAVDQVEPPPGLRDNLIARASDIPRLPVMLRPRRSPEDEPSGAALNGSRSRRPRTPPSRPAPVRTPAHQNRRRWLSSRGRRMIAASMALVAVLGIGGLVARTAQLQAERDAQSVQAQSIFDMVAQFDQPGTRHAFLTAAPGSSPVAAVLVDGGESKVLTVGLPPNATDRSSYVLWGMGSGGTPRAIGAFDVVSTQSGARNVGPVPVANGFTAYAVSIEPGRTVPAAPSDVVASGPVET